MKHRILTGSNAAWPLLVPEYELSHRGTAYIAVADEYDPHGRESTRIREMKKAPRREPVCDHLP